MSRRLSVMSISAVAVAAASLLMASSADAKVHGSNGRIVFAREIPALGDTAAFTIKPDGTNEKRLLPGNSAEIPRWSPNGHEIALLTCANPPDCTTAAAIVDPDTGKLMRWFPSPDPD